MKLWAKIGIGVGVAAVVGGLIYANLRSTGASAHQGDGPKVNAVKVQAAPMRVSVLAPGTIQATRDTDMRSPISSTSITLLVKAGDKVSAGQVLARLDTADLQQQVLQQRNALEQARAQLAQLHRQETDGVSQSDQQVSAADSELAQARAGLAAVQESLSQQADGLRQQIDQTQRDLAALQLAPTPESQDDAQKQADQRYTLQQKLDSLQEQLNAVLAPTNPTLTQAQIRLDSARSAVARAREQQGKPPVLAEQLAAAEQAIAVAEANLAYTQQQAARGEITAPFAGVVLAVDLKDAQPVQMGQRILELGILDTVQAKIRVDEVDVGRIAKDQAVTVRSVAFSGETFSGKVTRVAPAALQSNAPTQPGAAASFEVEADVVNPNSKLHAGMTADTEILIAQRDNVLAVGLETLVEENKESYLWVVGKDGIVHKVKVEVGLRSKTQAEIVKGLQAGDEVVTGPFAAMKDLKDGTSVNATVLPVQGQEGVAK